MPGDDQPTNPSRPYYPNQEPLLIFISSVMNESVEDLSSEREAATEALDSTVSRPWSYEFTAGTSAGYDSVDIEKVEECDIFAWIAGRETTSQVKGEVETALSHDKPILVFKKEVDKRTEETEKLLSRIVDTKGPKYVPFKSPDELARGAEATISDEIIRIFRQGSEGNTRFEYLARDLESKARCIGRWRSVGLSHETAMKLAEDPSIGATAQIDRQEQGLVIITGEAGIGKSLALERAYQEALRRAAADDQEPIPVFINGRTLKVGLHKLIEDFLKDKESTQSRGIAVYLDDADAQGKGPLCEWVQQARTIAAKPNHSVKMASRSLPDLSQDKEVMDLPRLSEAEALELVELAADRELNAAEVHQLQTRLEDSLTLPLFALLAGSAVRSESGGIPRNRPDLVTRLVHRLFEASGLSDLEEDLNAALRGLGSKSMDRGGGNVPASEMGSEELVPKLESTGLVVREPEGVRFQLPILAEWYASQALTRNEISVENLVSDEQRLEYWKPAIEIAVSVSGFDDTYDLVAGIVEGHPGLASEIIGSSVRPWHREVQPDLPSSRQVGAMIRKTTASWASALDPLAPNVLPLDESGNLLTLAIRTDGNRFQWAWIYDQSEEDIHVIRPNERLQESFRLWRGRSVSQVSSPDSAWPWRFGLELVRDNLSGIVEGRMIPSEDTPMRDEVIWSTARTVTGRRGTVDVDPIPVDEIRDSLNSVPEGAHIGGLRWGDWGLNLLEREIDQLEADALIESPWPGPDLDTRQSAWVWGNYSSERIAVRCSAVLEAALLIYQDILDPWFGSLTNRMSTLTTLPAEINAIVDPGGDEEGVGPYCHWIMEALQPSETSRVDVSVGKWDPENTYEAIGRVHDEKISMRSGTSSWIRTSNESLTPMEIIGETPATDLAFRWLWNDLKDMDLVDGTYTRTW